MTTAFNVLFLTVLFSCFCSYLVQGHESTAFTFELPDNEKQCFYQKYKGAKKLTLYFEVIRGGKQDTDFTIESPNGKEVYRKIKVKRDEINFESSFGVYSFCFSNEFSTFTHKVIYFELRPEGHESLADVAGQKKPTANTLIEETLDHIYRNAKVVKQAQNNFRVKESSGRKIAEDLSIRVHVWSIGEAIIILCMGLGQVIILRRFFSHIRPPTSKPAAVGNAILDLPKQSLSA